MSQAKKKFYDTELENLEKQQKQSIEKMEMDHTVRVRDEGKRIRLDQERAYNRFLDQMKHKKKEVIALKKQIWGTLRNKTEALIVTSETWIVTLVGFCGWMQKHVYICSVLSQVKQEVEKLPRSQRKDSKKIKMNNFLQMKQTEVCTSWS